MVQNNDSRPPALTVRDKGKQKVLPLFENDKEYRVRGERALWRAVIVQALMDAGSTSAKAEARHAREEALHWLTSMSADFRLVCDHAGLDPHYVRRVAKKALLTRIAVRSSGRKKQPRMRITRVKRLALPPETPGGNVVAFALPARSL